MRKRDNSSARERYASDPAWAEVKRSRSRSYYETNKDRVTMKRRADRARDPEAERAKQRAQRNGSPEKVAKARGRRRRWLTNNPEKAKAMARRKHLRKYGLTEADYQNLVERQWGRCALCEAELSEIKSHLIHIDHCHKTKRVRGVLCLHCNSLLGLAKEQTSTLRRAIAYLERNAS